MMYSSTPLHLDRVFSPSFFIISDMKVFYIYSKSFIEIGRYSFIKLFGVYRDKQNYLNNRFSKSIY